MYESSQALARQGRMMKNSEIAEAAAEYMEEHGWTRGVYRRLDGRVCLLGALRQVHPPISLYCENIFSDPDNVIAEILGPVLPDSCSPSQLGERVFHLNDHMLNSKDQALTVLTNAAKYWRDKGE